MEADLSVVCLDRDDAAYLDWIRRHRDDGFVINILRSLNTSTARLHYADCYFVNTLTGGTTWTCGDYIKVCSTSLAALDRWATRKVGAPIDRCRAHDCQPPAPTASVEASAPSARQSPAQRARRPALTPDVDSSHEFEGPIASFRAVWMWTDRYIPFERLSPAQVAAREKLRHRLRLLDARDQEILHASYAGFKPPSMDVENIVLYNIDMAGTCFLPSVTRGVRFELAAGARRTAPSRREFACSYQYRLIEEATEVAYWRRTERIAAFARVPFERGAKPLEASWVAVRTATVKVDRSLPPGAHFGVFLRLGNPKGRWTELRPEFVKGLVDGVVAAFQAHRDHATVDEIASRLARTLAMEPRQVRELLLDQERAVLGVVDRLVYLRGTGIQWNPSDHMCVVGEIVQGEDGTHDATLSGEMWAVEPDILDDSSDVAR